VSISSIIEPNIVSYYLNTKQLKHYLNRVLLT